MYCGHENEDSLVTCSVCGNRLGDAVPTREPVVESSEEGSADLSKEGNLQSTEASAAESAGITGDSLAAVSDEIPKAVPAAEEGAASAAEPAGAADGSVSGIDLSKGIADGANAVDAAKSAVDGAGAVDLSKGVSDAGVAAAGVVGAGAAASAEALAAEAQRAADEAMVTQEPAFAGQVPVNSQFGETTPAGQFTHEQNGYTPDRTPGYGEEWRQDVGRGQTYGARAQYEAKREANRDAGQANNGVREEIYDGNGYAAPPSSRDQYGSAGYGYRHTAGQEQPAAPSRGGKYGRRESVGGSKMFMVRARKRVKSVTFFLMALTFTAMLAVNAYNIYCGNALRNIMESDTMLANILSGTGTNFFTQMVTELASQLIKMVVNVQGIIKQLGNTVVLGIAITFLVPNVFYCLALWLMFFRTDTKRRQFPMGGYTLARVMMVFKFLIACLVLAIGLVISVYFVVVGAQKKTGTADSSLIQGVILLIVMIVLSVFVVMYYIQWMFCLKVVKDNAKKGTDPGRMPGFVVFLSILCGGACVALMIPMAPNDYIGLAARGCAAAYFFISGLWVLIYKIRVKRN